MRRKKSKASAETSGLVTSDAVQRKNHTLHSSRLLLILVLAAVVIVLGILGYAAWHTRTTSTVSSSSLHGQTKKNLYDPQNALSSAQASVKDAGSTVNKAAAYSSLGAAYLGTDQPKEAVAAYEQAVEMTDGQDLDSLIGLSNAYNLTGQHGELVATLQKIVTLMEKQRAADPKSYRLGGLLQWYTGSLERVENGGSL